MLTRSEELLELGRKPLLVVCDYDGTLAPIAPTPEEAVPLPGVRETLVDYVGHPVHELVILTGRRAGQVKQFLPLPDLFIVGLHGLEWPGEPLPEPDSGGLETLLTQLGGLEGIRLENKVWSLAAHYRGAGPERGAELEARLDSLLLPPGWERIRGKMVREFRPAGFGKGKALERLLSENPGQYPVFIGDDETDEEGFAVLNRLGGTGVKVGEGETLARHRLANPAQVLALLQFWALEGTPGG